MCFFAKTAGGDALGDDPAVVLAEMDHLGAGHPTSDGPFESRSIELATRIVRRAGFSSDISMDRRSRFRPGPGNPSNCARQSPPLGDEL